MNHSVFISVALAAAIHGMAYAEETTGFEKLAGTFINTHCVRCHGSARQDGSLRLDTLIDDIGDSRHADKWVDVLDRMSQGEMPPVGETRPDPAQQRAVISRIRDYVYRIQDDPRDRPLVVRRLTRREYSNTVRDLLQINFGPKADPALLLPPDANVSGFDKLGAGVSLDASLLESYFNVATRIANNAIVDNPSRPPAKTERMRFEYEDSDKNGITRRLLNYRQYQLRKDGIVLFNGAIDPPLGHSQNGELVPIRGRYAIRIKAGADPGHRGEPLLVRVVRQPEGTLFQFKVEASFDEPRVYEMTLPLRADGSSRIQIQFLNGTDFGLANGIFHEMNKQVRSLQREGDVKGANRIRAAMRAEGNVWSNRPNPATLELDGLPRLFLDFIEVEGPLYEQWPPLSHKSVIFGDEVRVHDVEYARAIFKRLLPRAYRRPVTEAEVDSIVHVFEDQIKRGDAFHEAVRAGIVTMLCSPSFLYVEKPDDDKLARPLNDHELASRLSYFLWSSMPDAQLVRLASSDRLQEPMTLDQQIDRMLADEKAEALVDDFAAQWLRVAEFSRFEPNRVLYNDFYDETNFGLDADMRAEPLHFFREVLRSDSNSLCFLSSDWTMLNDRLARFYGVAEVRGKAFRRVSLPSHLHRGGLITMAGVHRWGSDGSRTKPVERGKYILEVLFNDAPGRPPPNVGEVEPNVDGAKLTVRERLVGHQEIESCGVCHRKIDPYGLALENFNAVGLWREKQDGERRSWGMAPSIDASGILPNGREFKDFFEFRQALLEQSDRFLKGLAEKMFMYALGRNVEPSDRRELDDIVAHMKANGYTLRSLIKRIIHSRQFRTR